MMTPFVEIRRSILHERCQRLAAEFAASAIEWEPELSGRLPGEILADVHDFSPKASCRQLADLPVLAAAGFLELCITKPVTDKALLREAIHRVRQVKLTFTVDHFRQAELLSQAAIDTGCSIGVLIDTECGRQLTGVRPGPDSVRLAEAVSRLPGLTLAGVFVDDESVMTPGGLEPRLADAHQTADHEIVASHSRRIIRGAGIDCQHLASGRTTNPLKRDLSEVTRCMLNPLDESALDPIRLTEDSQADASEHKAWIVVTRVLSRPTLETCVIDIGHEITATQATILSPRGASFLMLANDVSSLTLTGPALDLRIGDLVKLQTEWRATLHLPFELLDDSSLGVN